MGGGLLLFSFSSCTIWNDLLFVSNIHQGKNRLENTVCYEIVPHKMEAEINQELHDIRQI